MTIDRQLNTQLFLPRKLPYHPSGSDSIWRLTSKVATDLPTRLSHIELLSEKESPVQHGGEFPVVTVVYMSM